MALDRLKSVSHHISGTTPPPHPFDPLSNGEIETAVSIIRSGHGKLHYNAVTLREPKKKEMQKWLENPASIPRPTRVADIVAIAPGGGVYDGLVDLNEGKIIKWEKLEGVQPLVSIFWDLEIHELIREDYYGGPTDCRACCSKRPQSH